MKNRIKYLTFIPLIIWIFLYIAIGILLAIVLNGNADFSSKASSSSVAVMIAFCVMSAISLFSMIWWIMIMNKTMQLDLFSKFIFIVTLNFPAYIMIKKSLQKNVEIDKEKNRNNAKYKINSEEKIDYDFEMLPDWEKEIIRKKESKKIKSTAIKKDNDSNNEMLLLTQRKIIRNYTKFVLYKVWKDKPELTSTFQITKLVNEQFEDEKNNLKFINQYCNNINEWCAVSDDELKIIPKELKEYAKSILIDTPATELLVAYKQDRVDITIEIKAILNRL